MSQIQKSDIYVYQGHSKTWKVTIVNASGGAWEDLADATEIVMSFKQSYDEADALVDIDYDYTSSDLEGGVVYFVLTSDDSALFTKDKAVYDIRVTKADGELCYPVYGDVYVQQRAGAPAAV